MQTGGIRRFCFWPEKWTENIIIKFNQVNRKNAHWAFPCSTKRFMIKVLDFLKFCKLFENEMFGDAYFDLSFRKNRGLRKPINLTKTEDDKMIMNECCLILKSIDFYNHPSDSFVLVQSAVTTILILFCVGRIGEQFRLVLYQWQEAIDGE